MRRREALGALGFAVLGAPAHASPIEALFAPSARLWERWVHHEPDSDLTVDHAAWDGLLRTYQRAWPDETTRINYLGITAGDRYELGDYIRRLSGTKVSSLRREEQRAFWINFYNALTMRVVIDAYPVASIRDIAISPGLFAIGPWGAKLATVEGEAITLNDIEHRILRPIWRDARIHYAVNCAAIGCPNLAPVAFTGANGEAMLESGARAYVNDPRGVGTDPRLTGLTVSKIYAWFVEDFGGESGVIAHLLRYAQPELAARIRAAPRLVDYRYDWALNDAR